LVFRHVSLGSNELSRAKAFYDPIMAELGYRMLKQSDRILAYGLTEVLFSLERPVDRQRAAPGNGVHIAFSARHRTVVDSCHKSGRAAGGMDDGAPGVREYDQHYYAAFLRDPEGNKIEIVTFSAD
jgi:catechol 2,3-dioxygenase-like lactoylglutathione lyase family enzyme